MISHKEVLLEDLKKLREEKVIVFCNSSEVVEFLHKYLQENEISSCPFFASLNFYLLFLLSYFF